MVFIWCLLPLAKGERGYADVDIAVFYRGKFLPVFLMYAGEILCLVRRNPFALVLLQSAHCRPFQFTVVFFHGDIHPCTALIVLDHSPDFAIDFVNRVNQFFTAVILRNLSDILYDFIDFALEPLSVRYGSDNITFLCLSTDPN